MGGKRAGSGRKKMHTGKAIKFLGFKYYDEQKVLSMKNKMQIMKLKTGKTIAEIVSEAIEEYCEKA
ncbi:MAG: hypothetical protein ACRC0V_08405 [Fusobacteriaceae bacterium]